MKFIDLKKILSVSQVGLIGMMVLWPGTFVVKAAAPGAVVINEVAWAGSSDSSNDEWLELYNPGAAAVDMSGWKIRDDGVDAYTFPAGASIAAKGYLLMEDSEVVTNVPADYIYNMSLANTGDTLQLLDAAGGIIDTVNASGGAWYAGSTTTFATMERKDVLGPDSSANFASSTGNGALASAGGAILGTPKNINSVATIPVGAAQIIGTFVPVNVQVNDVVKLQLKAENVVDLFAYGYELNYDAAILEYQGASVGDFLSANGSVNTAFQAGLKGGELGKLLLAEARTIEPKVGRSGSGVLAEVNFRVRAEAVAGTVVSFAAGSFSASPSADLNVPMQSAILTTTLPVTAPVTDLVVVEGAGRYQLRVSWTASASTPDSYKIERKNAHGQWLVLGDVNATQFVDQDAVTAGGSIIPEVLYTYRVTAVKAGVSSAVVEVSGRETRGIRGDNNRSDLVDGRDLERLARQFTWTDQSAGFDRLIDTTYDGVINGSDLIDIGAGFARKY